MFKYIKLFSYFILLIFTFSVSALDYESVSTLPLCNLSNTDSLYLYNSEYYMCKKIRNNSESEIILFESSLGSNDTINLLDNSINYNYFKIFFGYSAVSRVSSTEIYEPNNKSVSLILNSGFSNSSGVRTTNYFSGEYSIIDNSIIPGRHTQVYVNTNGAAKLNLYGEGSTNNLIYIYRVVGYKSKISFEYKKYSVIFGGSNMSNLSHIDIFFNDFISQILNLLDILSDNIIFLVVISSILVLSIIVLIIKLLKGGY